MIIHLLGTSAAVADQERDNTFLLICNENVKFLVDCPGSVVHKLSKINVDFKRIENVIITHIHPDHIYGLPSLIHSQYKLNNKLNIYSARESLEFIKYLILVYGLNDTTKYPKLNLIAISAFRKDTIYEDEEMVISCYPVKHAPESLGLKFILKNSKKKAGYTGDTGPCEDVILENENADYLIHDCLCPIRFLDRFKSLDDEHTSAYTLGKIANSSKIKNLIPIHFSTEVDFTKEELEKEIRQNYSGNIIIPNDFDKIEI